ncbi:MAG: hypothetical protein RIS29_1760 [Bacteroidota bacterium]|jgi:hypothetical protein
MCLKSVSIHRINSSVFIRLIGFIRVRIYKEINSHADVADWTILSG